MEDNLENKQKTQKNQFNLKTHKTCFFYKILKNNTTQLLPGNLNNTPTKSILAQLKNQTKSTCIGCDKARAEYELTT